MKQIEMTVWEQEPLNVHSSEYSTCMCTYIAS